MAIVVGYFKDATDCFTEGPFVVCHLPGDAGYRVEAQCIGSSFPVLVDASVLLMLRKQKSLETPRFPSNDLEGASNVVDWLNDQVKLGNIILETSNWCAIHYEGGILTTKERIQHVSSDLHEVWGKHNLDELQQSAGETLDLLSEQESESQAIEQLERLIELLSDLEDTIASLEELSETELP